MLLAAFIGAFLGSVLILDAFAHVLPRLLEGPKPKVQRCSPSRPPRPHVVGSEMTTAASGRSWIGLGTSDAVYGATRLESPIGVLLPMKSS